MKVKFRTCLSLAIMFTMALAVLANPAAFVARAQTSDTLVVGFAQEPDTMNGFYSSMAFGQWAGDLVYASLIDYNEKAEPVLVMAAELPTISEDQKSYTVKLKSGLKWSDGTAITADDVVFTYEMIMDKANNFSQATGIQAVLEKVEKIDDLTVKLSFNSEQPFFENNVSNINLPTVLPAHVFKPIYEAEKTLENAEANQNPTVFSGPYLLKEWKRGEEMVFVANPDFVLGKPKIENLIIRFFADTETEYAALAAGQIDWVPNVSEGDIAKVKSDKVTVTTVFGGYIEYLVFNLRTPEQSGEGEPMAGPEALRDLKVRQAIRLGIDRRKVVRELLADATTVTDSLYAASPFENKDLGFVEYNPEEAGKLLDEAGWVMGADGVREKNGQKLELRYATTTAGWRNEIQAVFQQDLAKIGVKTILEKYPSTDFFGQFANGGINASGNYHISEYANNTVLTNPVNVTVDELLGCSQIVSSKNPGGNNWGAYCNPKVDELVKITKTGKTAEERLKAALEAQVILAQDLPLITLFPRGDNYAYIVSRFVGTPRIGAGVGNQWFDIVNWQLQ